MTHLAPPPEEIQQVTEWLAEGGPSHTLEKLGEVEQFVHAVGNVKQMPKRVELLRLSNRMRADLGDEVCPGGSSEGGSGAVLAPLHEQIDTLAAAARAIRLNKALAAVFRITLFAGNRMNAGTSKGKARAFKLPALSKLRSTRTTGTLDGARVSLLDLIVRSSAKPGSGILPNGCKSLAG